MNAVREPTDYFRGLAAQKIDGLLAKEPDWLTPTRLKAIQRLQDTALPDRKQEGWRYTSLTPFLEHRFAPCAQEFSAPDLAHVEEHLLPGHEDYHRLVLVNGRFAAPLSNLTGLPQGVRVDGLERTIQGQTESEPALHRLGSLSGTGEHFFAALNSALMGDGAFIRIGRGLRLEKPIELLHLAVGGAEPPMCHPRHLVLLEEGAEATVIERFVSLEPSVYFTSLVSEIFLARRARLNHQRLQEESERALHLTSLYLHQDAASCYRGTTAALGGAWSRNEISVRFCGPDSQAVLNGLYMARDRQVTDIHLDVRHEVPGCASRENFKGILDGRGIGVFDGRVLVQRDAQQSSAHLANANLVLSRNAEIDTKPQLEIFADDVQCSHGTTVGQLDPDMLFYLRSRGIGEGEARKLICLGFAGEILETFEDRPLREHTLRRLHSRLDRSQTEALSPEEPSA